MYSPTEPNHTLFFYSLRCFQLKRQLNTFGPGPKHLASRQSQNTLLPSPPSPTCAPLHPYTYTPAPCETRRGTKSRSSEASMALR